MSKILTIGEPLIRLSAPKGVRLQDANIFDFVFGGAEFNVACNLAQLGNNVSFATKIPDNPFGQQMLGKMKSISVDTSQVLIEQYGRLGIYYLEFGDGYRSSRVVYDRKYSSFSKILKNEWDFDVLFNEVTHLHISGITLAVSELWSKIGLEILTEAKKRNIFVSFDMNYRQSMWSIEDAKDIYQKVIPMVDALSASHLDAKVFFEIILEDNASNVDYIKAIGQKYPHLSCIYGTDRINITPNSYKIKGLLYNNKTLTMFQSKEYQIDSVVDRVGTGDSYASGILDGIMNSSSEQFTVDFGMASAVLKHSIFGDINRFNRSDIVDFFSSGQNIVR